MLPQVIGQAALDAGAWAVEIRVLGPNDFHVIYRGRVSEEAMDIVLRRVAAPDVIVTSTLGSFWWGVKSWFWPKPGRSGVT